MSSEAKTFWDHLDELRAVIVRAALAALLCGVAAFAFKEQLFAIVLAPKGDGFITYRLLDRLLALAGRPPLEPFSVELINTGLATQFMVHMKVALTVGVICASPYILVELMRYVGPALYASERRAIGPAVLGGYAMFAVGVAVSYFVVFPLTFRFLGTYRVSDEVANLISLESYVSTLAVLSLSLGLVFEMPVAARVLALLGLLTSAFMRRYRRHALVVILVVAAVITPTTDALTLLIVATPMVLLYELSIWIVRGYEKNSYLCTEK